MRRAESGLSRCLAWAWADVGDLLGSGIYVWVQSSQRTPSFLLLSALRGQNFGRTLLPGDPQRVSTSVSACASCPHTALPT